jgi:anaerobic ribonucleoside-triphosphate reductase activating protein
VSTLRLAGIIRESIVDGPGIRFVVFVQGCPHACPGCHNPQTWDFSGGKAAEPERIIGEIKKNPLLRGVTLSGGEPFCQSEGLAQLARLVHGLGLDVMTYSGYTFEELLKKSESDKAVLDLLRQTDVLMDGPFIKAKKSYELRFRGSSNQRAIDVSASLAKGEAVLADI